MSPRLKRKNAPTFRLIKQRILTLMQQPIFWAVTLFGNGFTLVGALSLYYLEKDALHVSFLDCLSWAVGIVTTIGWGNFSATTNAGKIIEILMMLGGTLFIWSYMALFVSALVAPELSYIETEISELESDITKMKKEVTWDDQKIERLIAAIEKLHNSLDNKTNHTDHIT